MAGKSKNGWEYSGVVTEINPLYKGDNEKNGLNGNMVTLAQMGSSIQFYVPANVAVPALGEEAQVTGHFVPNAKSANMAKTKVSKYLVAVPA